MYYNNRILCIRNQVTLKLVCLLLFFNVGESLSVRRQIFEKLICKRRAEEEIAILQHEMCDYMRFYVEKVIPYLESELLEIEGITNSNGHEGIESFMDL